MTGKIAVPPGRELAEKVDPDDEVCFNCIDGHFPDKGANTGTCRAHPPTPIVIPMPGPDGQVGMALQSYQSPVMRKGTCGEFEPKAEESVKH